jgi:hypothetical protein
VCSRTGGSVRKPLHGSLLLDAQGRQGGKELQEARLILPETLLSFDFLDAQGSSSGLFLAAKAAARRAVLISLLEPPGSSSPLLRLRFGAFDRTPDSGDPRRGPFTPDLHLIYT